MIFLQFKIPSSFLVPPLLAQSGSKVVAKEMYVGNSEKRESLYGLEGVCLVVEGLNPVIEKNGLLTSRLQADVEEELSKAGIPVLPKEGWPTAPVLYVNVNAHKLDELFFYSIHVEFHQLVIIAREPSIEIQAPTWRVGRVCWISEFVPDTRGCERVHSGVYRGL